jgi:fatty acyl-CoA reductase
METQTTEISASREPQLKIKEFYEGKTIMLTGCTGFIGKVLLYKILKSIPRIGTIYLLVRRKRNQTPLLRVRAILESRAFQHLKDAMGESQFFEWATKKIIPVTGDLILERLGLSNADRDIVTRNCHVIINCAASIKFNDPLQEALTINYFGSLRMLELA